MNKLVLKSCVGLGDTQYFCQFTWPSDFPYSVVQTATALIKSKKELKQEEGRTKPHKH